MKRLLLSGIILLILQGPGLAHETIQVEFKAGTSKTLISDIAKKYGMSYQALKQKNTYRFTVPALRQQTEFTELFSYLTPVLRTVPAPVEQKSPYQAGQILVKYKSNIQPSQIEAFQKKYGIQLINTIQGIQVQQLQLPQNLTVNQALMLYQSSGLVEYAEPNYQMGLPSPVGGVPTAVQVQTHSQVIVDFKPGTTLKELRLFHQIYGTKEVQKRSFYSFLVQLPEKLSASSAERVMRLYPNVIHVQQIQS